MNPCYSFLACADDRPKDTQKGLFNRPRQKEKGTVPDRRNLHRRFKELQDKPNHSWWTLLPYQ
jgi:hypothetical protein